MSAFILSLWIIHTCVSTVNSENSDVKNHNDFIAVDDLICKKEEVNLKSMVYFEGENETKILPCNVKGSEKVPPKFDPPRFLWAKYVESHKMYNTSLDFDSNKYDFEDEGNMSFLEISNYNAEVDATIWCCLVPYNAIYGYKSARASYAVVEIPNEKMTISALHLNVSDLNSGDNVTLKCWEGPSVLDKIRPQVYWKTSGGSNLNLSTNLNQISFIASKETNGLKVSCSNIYRRDNAGGKSLILWSDQVTLNVKYPPEFDEDTTPSREPIETNIGSPVVLVASIISNPPIDGSSAEIVWKKALTKENFDKRRKRSRRSDSTGETLMKPCLEQSIDSSTGNFIEVIGGKYIFQTVIRKNEARQFYLIINNFAEQDAGCYVVQISSNENEIQRSFYLLSPISISHRLTEKSLSSNLLLWMTSLALFKVIFLAITSL